MALSEPVPLMPRQLVERDHLPFAYPRTVDGDTLAEVQQVGGSIPAHAAPRPAEYRVRRGDDRALAVGSRHLYRGEARLGMAEKAE